MNRVWILPHIFTFLLASSLPFACIAQAESEEAALETKTSNNATNLFSSGSGESEEHWTDNDPQITTNDNLEPSVEIESSVNKEIFAETALQNSVANEIINNDTPIIAPLSDSVTAELQQKANVSTIISSTDDSESLKTSSVDTQTSNKSHETKIEIKIDKATILNDSVVIEVPKNLTEAKNEEIPSFSEWAQKRLEEAEKKEQVNASAQSQNVSSKTYSSGKLRWKNYASLDCGAKVVLSNPEAVSPSAILSPSMDEYKLNTCTSRIWFVVELCEAIQVSRIDIANYELFSSSPKDFTVSMSDRFPTRDWQFVGHFTAKDERDVQSFEIEPQIFGKFVKVEIKSHYGSEHYCPISLFRAYGASVFEVLQKDDPANVNRADDENDDEDDDVLHQTQSSDGSKNIFTSATDAVINIVKKAAEVLGNKVNATEDSQKNRSQSMEGEKKACATPSHNVICKNCSDALFGRLFELLSCRAEYIKNLVSVPFIRRSLVGSGACQSFGLPLEDKSTGNSTPRYVELFFPPKYVGAMCNTIAVSLDKTALNVTQQYSNATETLPSELVDIKPVEPQKIIEAEPVSLPKDEETIQPTDPLEMNNDSIKSSYPTDISYTSQIQPTKTLASIPEVKMNTDSTVLTEEVTNTETSNSEVVGEETKSNETVENVEVISENQEIESVTESIEAIEDLISELNQTENGHSSGGTTQSNAPQQTQKESVFLRLSNRIKTLERNMSLSSQYLEELSKRYKKQVEEMQRLFEKTILALREESKIQDERNKQLEQRLTNLTTVVETLLSERHSAFSVVFWLFLCGGVSVAVAALCRRWSRSERPAAAAGRPVEVRRRVSIDVVSHGTPKKKRRRPSDQALKIVASMNDKGVRDKQKRRKKKVSLVRSNSLSEDSTPRKEAERDWIENVEDVPFALEESEHSTLEVLPLANEINRIDVPKYLQTATNLRLGRKNGSSLAGIAKKFNLKEKKEKAGSANVSSNGSVSSWTDTDQVKDKSRFRKLLRKFKSQTN